MKLLSAKEALTQSKFNREGYIGNRIEMAIRLGNTNLTTDVTKEELAQLKEQGYKVKSVDEKNYEISWE